MGNISSTDSILLEAPCGLESVRDAARILRGFLTRHGAGENELDDWELVTVEAGNNAVQSSKPTQPDQRIRFMMHAWPDSIELVVTDHNSRFDLPDEVKLPSDDSESGRGLFLMNALTDSVRYLRGKRENFLILRKDRKEHKRERAKNFTDVQCDASVEQTLNLMTQELGVCYESLSAIFRFSSEIGRSEDSSRFALKWLKQLLKATAMHWFSLRLFRESNGSLELHCTSLQENDGITVTPSILVQQVPHFLEANAANTGKEVWFDADLARDASDPLVHAFGGTICGVCYPIFVSGNLFGVLSIGRKAEKTNFEVSEVNVIHTFADFLGLQMSNYEVRAEALNGRLMRRELEVAGTIQRSLLPRQIPSIPGFSLSGHCKSANQVGGDYFDVIRVGTDGVLFAIADVMGKGVPAAMFAAIFRSYLHAHTEMMHEPATLMTWLNKALFTDLNAVDMFVTAQIAYLHLPTNTLTVASAGHCPLLVSGADGEVRELEGDGPPLGISLNANFSLETTLLTTGSLMLMLTDGLIDVRNHEGETLGQSPVLELLSAKAAHGTSAEDLQSSLLSLAETHRSGTLATDDLTFLVLAEQPTPHVAHS
jgi:serine phosphatase RsbU (regulator of sigma subunit)/anti-sigma regulatory factor (Ser/Thr protein kinase)